MGVLYGILGAIPSAILSLIYSSILDKYKISDKWSKFYEKISKNDNSFIKIIFFIFIAILAIASFTLTIGSLFLFIFVQNENWLYYILGTIICSFAELISFNIMDRN